MGLALEQFIWSIGAFIVALGLVVTFHEYGHFWVARKCGVKILTFSVGFGKPLWSWKGKDNTQYQVAAIPLGGYVKMLDHEVHPTEQKDLSKSFRNKSLWQRAAIVAAGPIANFIFSIVMLWIMLMIGMPALKPIVGDVEGESIAERAGIRTGTEVVRVDGHDVQDWQDVNLRLVARMGDEQTVITTRSNSGDTSEHYLSLADWSFDPESESTLSSLGLSVYQPKVTTELLWIEEDSPAQQAGLEVGDKIIGLNGTPVEEWGQITSFVAQRPNQSIAVRIERSGMTQQLSLALAERNGNGYMGVAPSSEPYPEAFQFTLKAGPIDALKGGVERTWQFMGLSLSMIKKLIVGDVGINNLSGPIGIGQAAGDHASYGLVYFLSFLALISVSLGILNLLPIPMLDGGHLLFYAVEGIQGKPVSEKAQEIGFRIGLAVLVLLTMVAVFNDINRLIP